MSRFRIENNIQFCVVCACALAVVLMVLVCSGLISPQDGQFPGGVAVGLYLAALFSWLSDPDTLVALP